MNWLWTRIDRILGAVVVASGAIIGSQIAPLIGQYLAQSGELLTQAEARLVAIQTGLKYQVMSDAVRSDLAAEAGAEVAALRAVHDPVAAANVVTKPFALWRNADPAMLDRTLQDFVPAFPTGDDAIFYVVLGILVAFAAYEALRWPVIELVTSPPRRRFRKKG